jgi:hypothetical protein
VEADEELRGVIEDEDEEEEEEEEAAPPPTRREAPPKLREREMPELRVKAKLVVTNAGMEDDGAAPASNEGARARLRALDASRRGSAEWCGIEEEEDEEEAEKPRA